MKILILIALALVLSGCESLQYAGLAHYKTAPVFDPVTKSFVGYSVDVINGKNIGSVEAHITKTGENFAVDLKEQSVDAATGQKISAEALQAAVDGAVKAALIAGGVMVAPVAGAVLGGVAATGGLGAAALGVGATVGAQKLAPAKP